MTIYTFIRHRWWLMALAAVVLTLLTFSAGFGCKNFTLTDSAGLGRPTNMPFLIQGTGPAHYVLRGELELSGFAPRVFDLVPDDKLLGVSINGTAIDLSAYSAERLQDVNRGITVDLGQWLHTGTNSLEIQFEDFSGQMGMGLRRSSLDGRTLFLALAWCALLFGLIAAASQQMGLRTDRVLLYALIVVGGLIKVVYIYTYNPVDHIFSDPERHWVQGIDVLRRDLMAFTDPIGYQIYVGLLAKFTLKMPELVAYSTSLLALLTPWLWYRFLREVQPNKTLALAGWAFLSLLPSWTSIYAYFMQETLLLPLLGAALWATWRCRRKRDAASFGIMIFLWIAAGLTRGIAIPMAAVACTWVWLEQDKKFSKAFYSILIFLFILGPLTARSYYMVRHFAPHGMGHMNVIYAQSGKKVIEVDVKDVGRWIFGSPSTGAKPFAPFSDWSTQRTGTVDVKVDLTKGYTDWKAALNDIHMSPSDYAWILKENLIFLFFADSWPDIRAGRLVDDIQSVMRWLWAPLFVGVIVLLAINARKLRGQWLLPSMIAAWFIVQGVIPIAINEGRYRKPIEGLLVAQLVVLASMRRAERKRIIA